MLYDMCWQLCSYGRSQEHEVVLLGGGGGADHWLEGVACSSTSAGSFVSISCASFSRGRDVQLYVCVCKFTYPYAYILIYVHVHTCLQTNKYLQGWRGSEIHLLAKRTSLPPWMAGELHRPAPLFPPAAVGCLQAVVCLPNPTPKSIREI